VIIFAFQPSTHGQQRTQPPLKVANKFDEYGRIGGCDHSARLDNLAVTLQDTPDLDGYILIYGPDGDGWRKLQFSVIRDYLVNARGLPEDRIKFIDGGRNSDLTEPRIELWLAPHDAAPPEPQHFKTAIDTFTGKFTEYQGWDGTTVSFGFDEGTGPPVIGVTLASFADMLQQQKQTTAYIVAYNGSDAVPGAWRRVAEREVGSLKKHGVEPSRLKVIYGGNGKDTMVQLWILPSDAPQPVNDAGPEELPKKAVQMDSFSDYVLGSEEDQLSVFKDLMGVLRLNEKLRACLIVRLETPNASDDAENGENQESQNGIGASDSKQVVSEDVTQSAPADFPGLIQKWTSQLATNKIQPDRFIVLFVPARELEGNTLEMWIVPQGVPLPDPFAEPENQKDDPNESEKPSQPKPSK